MRWLVTVLMACVLAVPAKAVIFIVSADHPEDVTPLITGYAESTASTGATIASGLTAASANGDTIYVHTGNYDEKVQPTHWDFDDMVLIGDNLDTTVLAWTSAANSYILGGPESARTGCSLVNITIDGDSATGDASQYAMVMSTVQDFTIDNVTTRGGLAGIIAGGVGLFSEAAGVNGLLIKDCTLAADGDSTANYELAAFNWATGSTVTSATDITIQDSTIDLADMAVEKDTFRLEAVTGFYIRNCIINFARNFTAAAGVGIHVRGVAPPDSFFSSDIEISDCVLTAQEMGPAATSFVAVTFGGASGKMGIIDDVLFTRNRVYMPGLNLHQGVKFEVNYNATPGPDAAHSDRLEATWNYVQGGQVGIDFHENSRYGIMANNTIVGPGKASEAGFNSFGIVLEAARKCKVFGNNISKVQRGISITQPASVFVFQNYDLEIYGNLVADSDYFYSLVEREGASDAVVDSLLQCHGNIAVGLDTFWYHWDDPAVGAQTLAQWQARVPPDTDATPYSQWSHGQATLEYESYPDEVMRQLLTPRTGRKIFGSGAGLRRK